MTNQTNSIWTAPIVERLREHHADLSRPSATVITARLNTEFGLAVSRSAVISKLRRLKLPLWGIQGAGQQHISRPPLPPVSRPPAAKPKLRKKQASPMSKPDPVSIWDVKSDQCRWPNDGSVIARTFLFCGARKLEGCSYCRTHQTASERRAAYWQNVKDP